jgi:branched-chain amino acid transport system ATP-binding protein
MRVEGQQALLQVSDVSKRFNGLHALKGVNLTVRRGETVALIGPNGAGKTTLFNVVTGNFLPDSGSVRFHGQEITKSSMSDIARLGLVRVFQKPRVFPGLTVWENLLIGCSLRNGKDGQIKDYAGQLAESAGLYKERHQIAGSLPFGKKRFLEVARALAVDPSLLLLDEAAAGLSPAEQDKLICLIQKELSEGKLNLLFIEHRSTVIAQLATRVVILSNGQKVFDGVAGESVTDEAIRELYTKVGHVSAT